MTEKCASARERLEWAALMAVTLTVLPFLTTVAYAVPISHPNVVARALSDGSPLMPPSSHASGNNSSNNSSTPPFTLFSSAPGSVFLVVIIVAVTLFVVVPFYLHAHKRRMNNTTEPPPIAAASWDTTGTIGNEGHDKVKESGGDD